MILGYELSAQDDDSYMLGEETYKPKDAGGFYDWRFGKDGKPHPATCQTCGRKINPDFVGAQYHVKKRKRDITATYDGYLVVSERFRRECVEHAYPGAEFLPLPSDPDFFWLRANRFLQFDSEKRRTRFEKYCGACGGYFSVIGADPVLLRNCENPLGVGFYRTDLEFGSGHEQHAIIIVGPKTADELKEMKFRGLELIVIKN